MRKFSKKNDETHEESENFKQEKRKAGKIIREISQKFHQMFDLLIFFLAKIAKFSTYLARF